MKTPNYGCIRVSRGMLPDSPRPCPMPGCVYRDAAGNCDNARINKGNSDARCHKANNRDVLTMLGGLK